MTRAVVTGGAGFIGSHTVDRLVALGMDVVVLDDLSTGDPRYVHPQANLVRETVCDPQVVRRVLADAEFVFHLAALPRIQPSFEDPIGHDEVNVIGTLHCLQAIRGSPRLRKFVFAGSSACYGNPQELPTSEDARIACLSPYALQKHAAEQYTLILGEHFGIPVVALRYFNVYGPRSFSPKNPFNAYTSVVGIFAEQRRAGQPLTITGTGEQSRDFVHVSDVVEANLLAARSERVGDVYNVGSGRVIAINNLAKMFDHPVTHIPPRPGEASITWADVRKIRADLGWIPKVSLEQGVAMVEA